MRNTLAFGSIHHPRRRNWLRKIAALLIPIHVLTLPPVMVWAETSGSGSIQDLVVPAIPGAPASTIGPDADLLSRENAQLAKLSSLQPAELPLQQGVTTPGELSDQPTDGQLSQCGYLPWSIRPLGSTTPEENATLATALKLFVARDSAEDLTAIEEWISQNPASVWRASVQAVVGKFYLDRGYFTRAIQHLRPAQAIAGRATGLAGEELAGQIAVHLTQALARAGRMDEARNAAAERDGKPQRGSVRELLRDARQLIPPTNKPTVAGACGAIAVTNLRRVLYPNTQLPLVLRSGQEQNRLNLFPASEIGLTLQQLDGLARASAVPLLPAKRLEAGEWVAPSIIHWKSNHYSLLLKKSGNRYLVRDPYLGGDLWLSKDALAEETTGFALIGVPNLPNGWRAPTNSELTSVTGKSDTPPAEPSPEPSKPCDEQTDGEEDCGECPCEGMPRYSLHLAQASLSIQDTPITFQPRVGPRFDFTVIYRHRNTEKAAYTEERLLGPQWETNWLSWVSNEVFADGGCPPSAEFPQSISSVSGSATVYNAGGGTTKFAVNEHEWVNQYVGGENNVVYCPLKSDITFKTDSRTHSTLKMTAGAGFTNGGYRGFCCSDLNPGPPDPLGFEQRMSDGTVHKFGAQLDGSGFSNSTTAFLASIVAPNGYTLRFIYSDNPFRLTQIVEVTALDANPTVVMSFNYEPGVSPARLSWVQDGAGRTASFQYNAADQLWKITDAEGMTSSFEYDTGVDFINKMITPYGETLFAQGGDGVNRWVETTRVIDGQTARQRVQLQINELLTEAENDPAGIPAGMNVRNDALNRRTTYYWNVRAMAQMGNPDPEDARDYSLARQIHWVWDVDNNALLAIPSSKKSPLESRVWYEYGAANAEPDHYFPLSNPLAMLNPSAIGRIVEGPTTGTVPQVLRYEYHTVSGRIIKTIDPINPDNNTATADGRTTEYEYYEVDEFGNPEPGNPDNSNGELLQRVKRKTGPATYEILSECTYNPTPASNSSDNRLPATIKDAAGQVTSYSYDGAGRITSVTKTRNGLQEIDQYDYYGANQGVNSYRLWKILAPNLAVVQELAYDNAGRVFSAKDADDYVVKQFYDNLDRPIRAVYPDGTYEQTIYNKLDPEWVRDRQGRWTRTEYNAIRKAKAITDPSGRKTQFDWCACGALDGIIDASNQTTSFVRDLQGRVTSKVYADSKATNYGYQLLSGRLQWVLDARNQRTNYAYWEDNNLKRVSYSDQNGNALPLIRADVNQPVEWTYETFYNRVASMNDTTGSTVYDYVDVAPGNTTYGDGRLESINGPLNNDAITYVYDEYGRVKERNIDGANNPTVRSFDPLGRVEWEANRLVRDPISNPTGKFNYLYAGNTGRLAEVNNGQGFRSVYDYYPNVGAAGTGNGDRQLSAVKHYSNTTTLDAQYDYQYTATGNINRWTLRWGAGLATGHDYFLAYDAADQLLGAEDKVPGTTNMQKRFGYTYDSASNRKVEQISFPGSGGSINSTVTTASYNPVNQLTGRTGGSGTVDVEGTVNERSEVKVEVKVGSTVTQPAQAVSSFFQKSPGTYAFKGSASLSSGENTVNVTARDANSNQVGVSRIVTSSGTAIGGITYDDAGNMVNDGTRQYVWDAASRLVKILHPGSAGTTEFTYDGFGRRVRIVETGTSPSDKRFVWDGLSIAEERNSSHAVTQQFFDQGERQGSSNFLYRRDHLDNIRELVNASGVMQSRYDYDLWGRWTKLGGIPNSNFAYTGHYYHTSSALALAAYRVYSADMGVWLSRDPIGEAGGINLYGYNLGDPINFSDPLGLSPQGGCGRHESGVGTTHGGTKADEKKDGLRNRQKRGNQTKLEKKSKAQKTPPPRSVSEEIDPGGDKEGEITPPKDLAPAPVRPGKGGATNTEARDTALRAGAAVGGGYILYRCIRMIPSLVPPLWPTLPVNAVVP